MNAMNPVEAEARREQPTPKEQIAGFNVIVSSVTAFVLIALYTGITIVLVVLALQVSPPIEIPGGVAIVYTTIGGLVSALVVAVLAATPPGGSPVEPLLGGPKDVKVEWSDPFLFEALPDHERGIVLSKAQVRIYSQREKWVMREMGIYLGAWILCGATALVIGVMIRPDVIPVLGNTGTTWLGIAVAAAYAYFGIRPK